MLSGFGPQSGGMHNQSPFHLFSVRPPPPFPGCVLCSTGGVICAQPGNFFIIRLDSVSTIPSLCSELRLLVPKSLYALSFVTHRSRHRPWSVLHSVSVTVFPFFHLLVCLQQCTVALLVTFSISAGPFLWLHTRCPSVTLHHLQGRAGIFLATCRFG